MKAESTVTLRFPRRLHAEAKIEATRRGVSLQEYVEQVVEESLGKPMLPARQAVSPMARRIAELPERSQKLVANFLDLLRMSPEFYLRAIEKHVMGSIAVFRHFDKRYFEEANADSESIKPES